jgi:hypothetical protein
MPNDPTTTGNGPWRILVLDRDPADPKWILATVATRATCGPHGPVAPWTRTSPHGSPRPLACTSRRLPACATRTSGASTNSHRRTETALQGRGSCRGHGRKSCRNPSHGCEPHLLVARLCLRGPARAGRPGLIEAPAGPTDPAGLRPGESGTPGLINVLAPGRLARGKERGAGIRSTASLSPRCDLSR